MFEDLRSLEREARQMRADGFWAAAEEIDDRIAVLQEDVEKCHAIWADLVNIANDQVRASQIVVNMTDYTDPNQRTSRLASAFFGEGLITPRQFHEAIERLRAPTKTTLKVQAQRKGEIDGYNADFQRIMRAIDPKRKQDAMAVYNGLNGPRDKEKLRRFVDALITKKMLPFEMRAHLRFDDWLNKLAPFFDQKVLHRPSENK